MKTKRIIIGNWKMNPQTRREAARLSAAVSMTKDSTVVLCPPFVFLRDVAESAPRGVLLGAQDVFWVPRGAYTGEISSEMLLDLGVRYVLLGHSERRALGEDDETINKKTLRALEVGLRVVLCIGETERDEEGAYLDTLKAQIEMGLRGIKQSSLDRLVIAYEPVWAIGAGAKADMPDSTFETVIFIRKTLHGMFPKIVAVGVPILYGGSVTSGNARMFIERGGVSGLLVGRASLDPEEFGKIIQTAV